MIYITSDKTLYIVMRVVIILETVYRGIEKIIMNRTVYIIVSVVLISELQFCRLK